MPVVCCYRRVEAIMAHSEDDLTQAERRVRGGEKRVARQIAFIETLDRDNHPAAAEVARGVLVTLRPSLELARDHQRMSREARGLVPWSPAAR